MHENHTLVTAADLPSYAAQLQAALLQTFGQPFTVYKPGSSWTTLGTPVEQNLSEQLSIELTGRSWSGKASQHPPMVVADIAGVACLAIPVDGPGGMLIAVGPTNEPQPTALRLAELFRRCWSLEDENAKYRKDLDICAAQIGDDFEELTFLRHLTEQLEASDATQTVWQVAQIVLPLLSPLIQAETLVLMPAQRSTKNSDEVTVGQPAVWVGPRPIEKQTCVDLVEHLRGAGARQPLIRNHYEKTPEGAAFPNVKEFILVPLDKGRFTVGWLLALNRTHRRIPKPDGAHWILSDSEFGTVEASLLSSVASMLATHARNVELIQEKEALLVAVVRAMVSAIDAKDPYTCGHSERVALVGKRLADELGLGPRECERLYLTGLLHDVGKIGVSDAVLRKPGKLSEEEFAEIQRHPDQGWAILQELDQLDYVFPGVLHHHESFNGRGYPDGLAGEQIPFVARILAVADAYDAMSSDRPYRKGMPQERVEEILQAGAGTQWDPKVIDAFFRVLSDIQTICESYQPHPMPSRKPSGVSLDIATITAPAGATV
jgi:response regulator RpfG family c-di-GMP phosphodiesterase